MIIPYLLMTLSILFATANGCFLHMFGNRDIKNMGDQFFFNGGIAVVWAILLGSLSLLTGACTFSATTLLYGCLYGVIIASFLLFKNLAMTTGPVSLSALIGNSTFLLTTAFGAMFLNRMPTALQLTGTVLILVSLFLCLGKGKGEKQEKMSATWLLYVFLFFLAGGGVGIVYMLFGNAYGAGNSPSAADINGMMLIAALTATVLYFLIGLTLNGVKKHPCPRIYKSGLLYILLCGIAGCVYMRLNLYLSTVIPTVIFFPIANGAMVILTALSGVLFFRERLNIKQTVGMAVGALAIVIVGLG